MQFRYICLIFYHYEWLYRYLSKAIKPILAMVGLNLLNEHKKQDEGHWNMYESSMKYFCHIGGTVKDFPC